MSGRKVLFAALGIGAIWLLASLALDENILPSPILVMQVFIQEIGRELGWHFLASLWRVTASMSSWTSGGNTEVFRRWSTAARPPSIRTSQVWLISPSSSGIGCGLADHRQAWSGRSIAQSFQPMSMRLPTTLRARRHSFHLLVWWWRSTQIDAAAMGSSSASRGTTGRAASAIPSPSGNRTQPARRSWAEGADRPEPASPPASDTAVRAPVRSDTHRPA